MTLTSLPLISLDCLMKTASNWQTKIAFNSNDLADESNAIYWPQFNYDVSELAQQLLTSKAKRWALCFENSYQFAVAFMAAIHSNKNLVLPSNYQTGALQEIENHFDGILLDSHTNDNYQAKQHETDIFTNKEYCTVNFKRPSFCDKTSSQQAHYPFKELDLAQIRLTLFTSGSSGKPKAIKKNLQQLNTEIQVLEQLFGDKIANCDIQSTVSHQHIYGLLFRVLWPLCTQRPFACNNLTYPEQVLHKANENSCLISSPALLKRLFEQKKQQNYHYIFSSGGPLDFEAAEHCSHLFGNYPIEIYGSTETGGIGYRQQFSQHTPWQGFPCHQITVNDEGCLQLNSPFISTHNYYETSDLCELIGENQFMLKGRSDKLIKIEEKRISLTEVERHLCGLSWVNEACVVPINDGRLYLGAVITLTQEGKDKQAQLSKGKLNLVLRQSLRTWLEPVGIPRRFRIVDELPVNSQGKIQLQSIKALFSAKSL